MKSFVLALSLSAFQTLALAASPTPVLVLETGSLANYGQRTVCEIYETHPALKGKVSEIREKIMNVSAQEMTTVALFMKAQIPSEQVFAYETMISFVPQKVELERVYSNHSAIVSKDAQELILLARKLCQ